jgi:hypothetical protein
MKRKKKAKSLPRGPRSFQPKRSDEELIGKLGKRIGTDNFSEIVRQGLALLAEREGLVIARDAQ